MGKGALIKMTTTALVLALVCGLPLLAIAILGIVIAIWGVKTLWKIVTWPFRAIAGLFHKNETPASVAAPVAAPVPQEDRNARYGAPVTQTVTLNNNGVGGTALAIVALVAVLVIGAFVTVGMFFRTAVPTAAPVAAPTQIVYVAAPTAVVPVVAVPTASVPTAPVPSCKVIHDYQLKDLSEVATSVGNYIHVEFYVDGQPEFETLLPGGRYTLNTQFPGGHVWEYSGCSENEVMVQINAHIARRLSQKANNGGFQEWKSTGFFSPVQ